MFTSSRDRQLPQAQTLNWLSWRFIASLPRQSGGPRVPGASLGCIGLSARFVRWLCPGAEKSADPSGTSSFPGCLDISARCCVPMKSVNVPGCCRRGRFPAPKNGCSIPDLPAPPSLTRRSFANHPRLPEHGVERDATLYRTAHRSFPGNDFSRNSCFLDNSGKPQRSWVERRLEGEVKRAQTGSACATVGNIMARASFPPFFFFIAPWPSGWVVHLFLAFAPLDPALDHLVSTRPPPWKIREGPLFKGQGPPQCCSSRQIGYLGWAPNSGLLALRLRSELWPN